VAAGAATTAEAPPATLVITVASNGRQISLTGGKEFVLGRLDATPRGLS